SRKMKKVINISFQRFQGFLVDTEVLTGQVANHRFNPALINAPAFTQHRQLALRLLTNQKVDITATGEKLFNKKPANKSGATGQEIVHGHSPCLLDIVISRNGRIV